MNIPYHIGINGLFLRKPGSGIGVVTKFFLATLPALDLQGSEYTVYTDSPDLQIDLGAGGKLVYIKPLWKRDDLVRKLLWEHIQLPKRALKDGVTHFLSLYQAPTEFPKDIRHTMVVHDVIPEIFPAYRSNSRARLLWNLTKRGIREATHVAAVSYSTQQDLIEYLQIEKEKIEVVYPSINPLFFESPDADQEKNILAKYNLTSGYIYHGGGLEIRKNTESVLRAYAEWIRASDSLIPPLVISGHIHGSDNPLATNIKKLITDLRIESHVRLLGFVPDEDLPVLYRNAALFLFPSRYEGFGMPVVEALSQGTLVMATRNSSLSEVGGDFVCWVEELTQDNLETHYAHALQSSVEEKNARIEQARHFQSWTMFTQKILDTLVQ